MKIFGKVLFYIIIAAMTAAVLTGCQTLLDEFLAIDWETPAEAPEEPKVETPAPEPAAPPPKPEPAAAEIADQRMTEILDEPEEAEEDFLVIDSIADPFEVLLQDPLILLITAPDTDTYVFRHLTFDVIDVYAAVFDFIQDAPLNDNFDGEQLTETFEADLIRGESYLIFIAPLDDKDFGKTVRFSVLPAEKPPEPAEIPDPEPPAPEGIPDPEPPAPVVIPDPEPAPPEVPAAVPPVRTDERIKMIAAGYENSFVLLHDGTLLATGHNGFGQFGDGSGISRTSFTPIADNVKTFSVSEFGHLLAVKNDGALYASGYNVYGQLGDGTKTDRFSFVKTADGVRSVSAGSGHSMILKEDGTLWAAGDNTFGQLGDGTREHRSTFVQVAQQVASVQAGNSHTVLVKEDGSIWAAGHNSFGELGDGTTRIRTSFVRIAGSADQVYAEGGRTLLLQDSQLSAAGQNWYGELGRIDSQALSQFTTLASEVRYASSGAFHTMFIDTDGVLHAAGFNGYGRLGSGTLEPVSSYTPVSEQVLAVSAGARHTLMLKEDGTLWAAGNNDHGQLGLGHLRSSVRFTQIIIPAHTVYIPADRTEAVQPAADPAAARSPAPPQDGEYRIGSIGPAGGLIVYDRGITEGWWRYIEMTPAGVRMVNGIPTADMHQEGYSSAPTHYKFGFSRETPTGSSRFSMTRNEIGHARANTTYLVMNMGDTAYTSYDQNVTETTSIYAAKMCDDLVFGGFNDWSLPTADELAVISETLFLGKTYDEKRELGLPLDLNQCWSSTEVFKQGEITGGFTGYFLAIIQDFQDDKSFPILKNWETQVFAVRYF